MQSRFQQDSKESSPRSLESQEAASKTQNTSKTQNMYFLYSKYF